MTMVKGRLGCGRTWCGLVLYGGSDGTVDGLDARCITRGTGRRGDCICRLGGPDDLDRR